jgi:hypothetical protein
MARIEEYNAPGALSIIRPTETGEQAISRAASMRERRAQVSGDMRMAGAKAIIQPLEQGVKEVGSIVDEQMSQSEISNHGASGMELMNQKTKELNEFTKSIQNDPEKLNNPDTYKNWMQQNWAPAFDKWKDGFNTRRGQDWGMQYGMNMNQHMMNATTAESSHAAGAAALLNLQNIKTQASDMVAHSPDSLDTTIGMMNANLEAALKNPNIKAEDAQKIREEFLKSYVAPVGQSAIYARMAKNPSGVLAELAAGKYDKLGLDLGQIKNIATERAQSMADRALSEQLRSLEIQRIQKQNVSDDALKQGLDQFMTKDDRTGLLVLQPGYSDWVIGNRQKLTVQDYQRAIQLGDQTLTNQQRAVNNPGVIKTLLGEIETGEGNARQHIDEERIKGNLTPEAYGALHDMMSPQMESYLKDPAIRSGLDGALKTFDTVVTGNVGKNFEITKGNVMQYTATGAAIVQQQFHMDLLAAIGRAPTVDAATKMLDPSNTTSPLNQANLAKYLTLWRNYKLEQAITGNSASATRATPPANAGALRGPAGVPMDQLNHSATETQDLEAGRGMPAPIRRGVGGIPEAPPGLAEQPSANTRKRDESVEEFLKRFKDTK